MKQYTRLFFQRYELLPHEVFCALCGQQAVDLHHIIKKSKSKERINDTDNLLPVCRKCHDDCERRRFSEEEQFEFLRKWRLFFEKRLDRNRKKWQ